MLSWYLVDMDEVELVTWSSARCQFLATEALNGCTGCSYHIPPLGGILAHIVPRTKENLWRRAPQEMLMQKVIEQFQFAGCCGSI